MDLLSPSSFVSLGFFVKGSDFDIVLEVYGVVYECVWIMDATERSSLTCLE
jgi:hypothetical protein